MVLNSVARLAADIAGTVLGLITGVITARWLGPANKGDYAAITLIAGIFASLSMMGLGDAGIVLVGRRERTFKDVLRHVGPLLGLLTVIGGLLFMVTAAAQFSGRLSELIPPIIVAAISIPLVAASTVLGTLINARERVLLTSTAFVTSSAVATIATAVFLMSFSMGTLGAVMAVPIGALAGLALLVYKTRRAEGSVGFRWDRRVNLSLLRLGIPIQAAAVLMTAAARLDLLIVYQLAGRASAGRYSVALTVGQLVVFAPFAISFVTFPRIARLDHESGLALARIALKAGAIAALGVAILLALITPLAIPLLFGSNFRTAIAPAVILLFAGVPWGIQWMLCRVLTAKGKTFLLFVSFGLSLSLMLGLDIILIPMFGVAGAAWSAFLGSLFGLIYACWWYERYLPEFELRSLRLGKQELAEVIAILRSFRGRPK